MVDLRLVPFHRDSHPALDGRLQLGIVGLEMERVAARVRIVLQQAV